MIRWILAALVLASLGVGCASAPVQPEPLLEPDQQVVERIRIERRRGSQPDLPALPPATRQIREGYWLGALLSKEHVAGLRARGIRVVVSAVRPDEGARQSLEASGMSWVFVPMGSTFDHADELLGVLDRYAPEETYLHCRHGADRTGAMAAFILVVRHGWSIADALYSVVYPSTDDVDGLAGVLSDFGIADARFPEDPTVGFYSLRAAGEIGGLKARNARYARLVATTIEAIRQHAPAWSLVPGP